MQFTSKMARFEYHFYTENQIDLHLGRIGIEN